MVIKVESVVETVTVENDDTSDEDMMVESEVLIDIRTVVSVPVIRVLSVEETSTSPVIFRLEDSLDDI